MTKKISTALVKETIEKMAVAIKRKEEIYEELKKYNTELSTLNEVGMVGSFGFATPNDASNRTKTGFVESQPLSYVAQLMDDHKEEPTEEVATEATVQALKEENSSLKIELEALKKQITPAS